MTVSATESIEPMRVLHAASSWGAAAGDEVGDGELREGLERVTQCCERWMRAPTVVIVGRPGIGKRDLAEALAARIDAPVCVGSAPDGPRRTVVAIAESLRSADRIGPGDVVALVQAETFGSWRNADAAAAAIADRVGCPVYPVMTPFAARELTEQQLLQLRRLADSDRPVPRRTPELVAAVAAVDPDGAEPLAAQALAVQLGRYGIAVAVGALREHGRDPRALLAKLSGVDELVGALADLGAAQGFAAELDALARRYPGAIRDGIEGLTIGGARP